MKKLLKVLAVTLFAASQAVVVLAALALLCPWVGEKVGAVVKVSNHKCDCRSQCVKIDHVVAAACGEKVSCSNDVCGNEKKHCKKHCCKCGDKCGCCKKHSCDCCKCHHKHPHKHKHKCHGADNCCPAEAK
jgi:hypothetical protein